jgi:hypothetical protein
MTVSFLDRKSTSMHPSAAARQIRDVFVAISEVFAYRILVGKPEGKRPLDQWFSKFLVRGAL